MDEQERCKLIKAAAFRAVNLIEDDAASTAHLFQAPAPAIVNYQGWVEVVYAGNPAWTNGHMIDLKQPVCESPSLEPEDYLRQKVGMDVTSKLHFESHDPLTMVGLEQLLDENERHGPDVVFFLGKKVVALQMGYVQHFLSRYENVTFHANANHSLVQIRDSAGPVGVVATFHQKIESPYELEVAIISGAQARMKLKSDESFIFNPDYGSKIMGDEAFSTKKAALALLETLHASPEETRRFHVVPRNDHREWFVRAEGSGSLLFRAAEDKAEWFFVQGVTPRVVRVSYYSEAYPSGRYREFDSLSALKGWILEGGIEAESVLVLKQRAEQERPRQMASAANQIEDQPRFRLGGLTIVEVLEKAIERTKGQVQRARNVGDAQKEEVARRVLSQQRQTVFDVEETLNVAFRNGTVDAITLPECFSYVTRLIESGMTRGAAQKIAPPVKAILMSGCQEPELGLSTQVSIRSPSKAPGRRNFDGPGL